MQEDTTLQVVCDENERHDIATNIGANQSMFHAS